MSVNRKLYSRNEKPQRKEQGGIKRVLGASCDDYDTITDPQQPRKLIRASGILFENTGTF